NTLVLRMVHQPDPFHVIQRYESDVVCMGRRFRDRDCPRPADVLSAVDFDNHLLRQLRAYMEDNRVYAMLGRSVPCGHQDLCRVGFTIFLSWRYGHWCSATSRAESLG